MQYFIPFEMHSEEGNISTTNNKMENWFSPLHLFHFYSLEIHIAYPWHPTHSPTKEIKSFCLFSPEIPKLLFPAQNNTLFSFLSISVLVEVELNGVSVVILGV